MATQSTASLHPHTIALDTRFFDAPLGGAGRYRSRPGGARRSPISRALASFSRKLSRLANAVAPGQLRAQPRLRAALRDCSHRMGDLVGEVVRAAHHDPELRALGTHLQNLYTAADRLATLLDAPGTAHHDTRESIVGQRLAVHLRALGLDHLVALALGAKAIRVPGQPEDDDGALQALPRRIVAEVHCQLDTRLSSALDAVIAALLRAPDPLAPEGTDLAHWVRWLQDNLDAAHLAGRSTNLAARLDPALDALDLPQRVDLAQRLEQALGPMVEGEGEGDRGTGLLREIQGRCGLACQRRGHQDTTDTPQASGPLDPTGRRA